MEQETIRQIIQHLEKQKRNQSMGEDFMDGFDYAIFEINSTFNKDYQNKLNGQNNNILQQQPRRPRI